MADGHGSIRFDEDGKFYQAFWVQISPFGDVSNPICLFPASAGDATYPTSHHEFSEAKHVEEDVLDVPTPRHATATTFMQPRPKRLAAARMQVPVGASAKQCDEVHECVINNIFHVQIFQSVAAVLHSFQTQLDLPVRFAYLKASQPYHTKQ